MGMCRINPLDSFRHLHRLDIRQVDSNGLVIASHQNALQGLVLISINLLMRHIRRHKYEVPRSSFSSELEFLAPPHACFALDDVNYRLQMAVVVGTGFGVRVDVHCACPDLLGSGASEVDSGRAVHAWRLRCVAVEGVGWDYSNAFVFPAVLWWWRDF